MCGVGQVILGMLLANLFFLLKSVRIQSNLEQNQPLTLIKIYFWSSPTASLGVSLTSVKRKLTRLMENELKK
jgi:hypothetical protein